MEIEIDSNSNSKIINSKTVDKKVTNVAKNIKNAQIFELIGEFIYSIGSVLYVLDALFKEKVTINEINILYLSGSILFLIGSFLMITQSILTIKKIEN